MSECTHDCSSCGASCGERTEPQDLRKPANKLSNIKKVIAVVSGKGGVGKSAVTCTLASAMAKRGRKVGVLDADITGPSVPQAFNIHQRALGSEDGILPAVTEGGVKLMSLNLLIERETDPVVWRGPVIAGAVEQFWTDVVWGELDYLFVDMPPGTGDVPLTVFQSLPVDGVVVVTAPQALVGMIVTKAVRMAEMMNVPVLGLVENYSYFRCPDCGGNTPCSARAPSTPWGRSCPCRCWPSCPLIPRWPGPWTKAGWSAMSPTPWTRWPSGWTRSKIL